MKKRGKSRRRGRRRRRGGRKRRAGGGEMRRRTMPHFTDFSTFPIRDHFSKYYKTKISILFWNFSPQLKIPIRITFSSD
jgi:hypothetical protein